MKKNNSGMNAMYKIINLFFISLVITACDNDPATRLQNNIDTGSVAAVFNPSDSDIPYPNDLLFQGTTDGTLNIPVANANDLSDPAVAINALDGFSTTAPMTATFGSPIDSTTIAGNVRVFTAVIDNFVINPTSPTFGVGAVTGELTFGVDFVATVSSQTTLVISPLKPLAPKSGYLVVITNGLTNTNGDAFRPDTTYALAKQVTPLVDGGGVSQVPALSDAEALQLEGLRQLTNAAETAANTYDASLATADIILSWSFSTQSVGDVLVNERTDIRTTTPLTNLADSLVDSTGGLARFYKGTLEVPYYLEAASSSSDSTPLTTYWKGAGATLLTHLNPNAVPTLPAKQIPLLVSIPKPVTSIPAAGFPVVIFQHGLTGNRTSMMAVADAFASIGFAVVAIDLPLHGITDSVNAFYDSANERTFGLDLINNATNAAGPDGIKDSSGIHFVNLTSLLTTRDNVRQSVTDLFALTKSLDAMDFNGDVGLPDFDTANIFYLGHSLGGIVGTPFLALESTVKDAVLAMPGSGVPKILDGSATYGALIADGLAAAGVIKGTADYEAFMGAAQTVVDSADPANYAVGAATGRGVLMFEIVGGAGSPSDLVVPNTVPDANDTSGTVASPLAGTEPLISLMGLTQDSVDRIGTNLLSVVKFSAGHHSSILTPSNVSGNPNVSGSAETYAEMHSIMKDYISSNGAQVNITDTTVISP